MFVYADNCTEALMLSRTAFFALYGNYNKLDKEANECIDELNEEKIARAAAQQEADEQRKKKKAWRGVAIGQGVGILGAIAIAVFLL